MKILIVVATKTEIEQERFANCDILITGVGMLNTAICLTQKLSDSDYDLLINMGVAGTFNSKLKIGDVVEVIEDAISELGYEDTDGFSVFTELNLKSTFTNRPRTQLLKVKSITVNTVHGNEKSISTIVKRLSPDIENMEGAVAFQLCERFNVPCMQIRSISNKIEQRNKNNWDLPLAIKNLNKEVEKIIAKL
ncbi:MAG: futalosine hydrolase [Bacteroidota bacterium]|nr:futalosine hydrolase [Bacteroidota bacterium]